MSENIYLKVLFVVLMAPTVIKAGIFDDTIGVAMDGICAMASINEIDRCGKDFNNEIQNANNQMFEELGVRKVCCAFNHLRDCVIDAIGDKCGDSKDSTIDKIVSLIIATAKTLITEDKCRTYTGTTGNVLCLSDLILILIIIGLVVLFLFVCCGTIKMCCGSGRRYRERGSAQFVLLPQHNGDKPRY